MLLDPLAADHHDSPHRAELDPPVHRHAERKLPFPIIRRREKDLLPSPDERAADRGDVLIQLVRSRISAPPEAVEALDSLNLHRIGHVRVIDHGPSTAGVIRTVRPWIRTYPLTIDAAESLLPLGSEDARAMLTDPARPSTEPEHYEEDDTCGWSMDWSARANRDYFRLERQRDALAVGWSTALPLASILRLFEAGRTDPIGFRKCEVAVSDWSARGWRRGAAAHLADELRWGWRPYETALFSGPDVVVQWRTPEFPRHVDERVLSGDLHVRFTVTALPGPSLLEALITATATPRVSRELAEGGVFRQLAAELTELGNIDIGGRRPER
jgi:ribosomal protein L30/L7E